MSDVGAPASGGRSWTAGLIDQLVLIGWFLGCLGAAMLLPDSAPDGLQVASIVTGAFGAVVIVVVETVWLKHRGTTLGMWVLGVRVHPSVQTALDEGLEYFFYFWLYTLYAPVGWVFGWLLDLVLGRSPHPQTTDVVHDLRTLAFLPRVLRLLLLLAVLASPVPLVLALAS